MSSSAIRNRGKSPLAIRLSALRAASFIVTAIVIPALALAACTVAPEPPPTPQAVVQLSECYDRPTASLDQPTARRLFEQRLPQLAALESLAGLAFLRQVIAQGTTPDIDGAEQSLDVQGSLEIHAPCPGWDALPAADEDESGFIDLVIGVDDSRVQRAFTGRATACRFAAKLGDERVKVDASMQFEVDLGHSLGLGEPIPAILLRMFELSAELSDTGDRLDLDALGSSVSARIGGQDLLETLIDLEPLNLGQQGTILLGLRDDGSVGVRGRDSAWVCSGKRSAACVRSD